MKKLSLIAALIAAPAATSGTLMAATPGSLFGLPLAEEKAEDKKDKEGSGDKQTLDHHEDDEDGSEKKHGGIT